MRLLKRSQTPPFLAIGQIGAGCFDEKSRKNSNWPGGGLNRALAAADLARSGRLRRVCLEFLSGTPTGRTCSPGSFGRSVYSGTPDRIVANSRPLRSLGIDLFASFD